MNDLSVCCQAGRVVFYFTRSALCSPFVLESFMPTFHKSCGEWYSRINNIPSLLQVPPIPHAPAVNFPIARALDPLELGPLRDGEKSHG